MADAADPADSTTSSDGGMTAAGPGSAGWAVTGAAASATTGIGPADGSDVCRPARGDEVDRVTRVSHGRGTSALLRGRGVQARPVRDRWAGGAGTGVTSGWYAAGRADGGSVPGRVATRVPPDRAGRVVRDGAVSSAVITSSVDGRYAGSAASIATRRPAIWSVAPSGRGAGSSRTREQ